MTPRRKALEVADDRSQRGARQCTDAGDLAQLLHAHIGASQGAEFSLDAEDLLLEQPHFLQHLGNRCTQGLRNLTLGIADRCTDPILGDIDPPVGSQSRTRAKCHAKYSRTAFGCSSIGYASGAGTGSAEPPPS